jgi:hypothetical protein
MSTEVATNEKSYSFFRESFWGFDDYKDTYYTGAPLLSVIDTKLSITEDQLTKFINKRKKETIYQLKGFFRGGVDNQNSRDEFTNYGTLDNGALFHIYLFLVKYVCPICILFIFLHQFGLL